MTHLYTDNTDITYESLFMLVTIHGCANNTSRYQVCTFYIRRLERRKNHLVTEVPAAAAHLIVMIPNTHHGISLLSTLLYMA